MKNERNINPNFPSVIAFLHELHRAGVVEKYKRLAKEQDFERNMRITYQWFSGVSTRVSIAEEYNISVKRVEQIATRTFRRLYEMSSFRQQLEFLQSIDVDNFKPQRRTVRK